MPIPNYLINFSTTLIRYSKKTSAQAEEMKPDVIIVGSGLGSLTTGSLLAQRGWKVLILEQHDQVRPGQGRSPARSEATS